jgi:uncharacterized protein
MAQRRSSSNEHPDRDATRTRNDAPPRPANDALRAALGQRLSLEVDRVSGGQAWVRVATDIAPIPTAFGDVPAGTTAGSHLDVFVCADARDLPVASLRTPALEWGEVRFLEVVKETQYGAWVEWGLPVPLFVPKREQITRMRVGTKHPVALCLSREGLLAGTTHVTELLHLEPAPFEVGQWVHGEAWRNDPEIGLFAILEGKWVGRVPPDEPHQQERGQAAEYRIGQVLPDGKLEVSLRATIAAALPRDVEHVLTTLNARPALRVGDDTSPEQVRALFGLSKKAFKRALGVLFKRGQIEFDAKGFARVTTRH